MTINEKEEFLKKGLFDALASLSENATPAWGKMNAWQMVEHMASFFRVSTAKLHFELATPVEHLPKYKAFLRSDIPFKENTKAPTTVLGEDTLPVTHESFEKAKADLKKSVDDFFDYFENNFLSTTLHPAFGELNREEWILLHYKHVTHHLRQFQAVL